MLIAFDVWLIDCFYLFCLIDCIFRLMRELERSMLSSKQEKEDLSRDLCEVCFLITKKGGGGRNKNESF